MKALVDGDSGGVEYETTRSGAVGVDSIGNRTADGGVEPADRGPHQEEGPNRLGGRADQPDGQDDPGPRHATDSDLGESWDRTRVGRGVDVLVGEQRRPGQEGYRAAGQHDAG